MAIWYRRRYVFPHKPGCKCKCEDFDDNTFRQCIIFFTVIIVIGVMLNVFPKVVSETMVNIFNLIFIDCYNICVQFYNFYLARFAHFLYTAGCLAFEAGSFILPRRMLENFI